MSTNTLQVEAVNGHGQESKGSLSKPTLTRLDIIRSYRVTEVVTLARDGFPVCWPKESRLLPTIRPTPRAG